MKNNYYQKHKERLQKEARERQQDKKDKKKKIKAKKALEKYQNFTEEGNKKRHQYYLEHQKNLLTIQKKS